MNRYLDTVRRHREREQGAISRRCTRRIALSYPSPYSVGMASLGFQAVYGRLNHLPDVSAERFFLPEPDPNVVPVAYESGDNLGEFPLIAFSVAYELELTGLFQMLEASGIPLLAGERDFRHPLVVAGGPLTFSNPVPLTPFVDVVVMGEAEDVLGPLVDTSFSFTKDEALKTLASLPGFYVPSIHGTGPRDVPLVAKAHQDSLPAASVIITPDSALPNMFLIEPERGCSRGCSFCVMRRTTNGGMRLVDKSHVLGLVPEEATRVGLVGAAVSDHPQIVDIVGEIVARGKGVGLSSLRADKLTPEFVEVLTRGGYRTLTVASDGASERLRIGLEKKIRGRHLLRAAELAGQGGVSTLKVYMMVGVPGESDDDIEELADFTLEQVKAAKPARVALGVAPFVAKRNTPLDGAPFLGIKEVDRRMALLRKRLKGQAELRPVSARWAWVEYELSQGGEEAGIAAMRAWRDGGRFAHWKKHLSDVARPEAPRRIRSSTTMREAAGDSP